MQRPSKTKLCIDAYILDTVKDLNEAQNRIASFLRMKASISLGAIKNEEIGDSVLRSYCYKMDVELCDSATSNKVLDKFIPFQCDFSIRLIVLKDGPLIEEEEGMTSPADGESQSTPCQIWDLPNRDFMGLVSNSTQYGIQNDNKTLVAECYIGHYNYSLSLLFSYSISGTLYILNHRLKML